ncbi:ABC transporter permease [Vibrio sp. JC009]|uniref:ABC transporter permease n=1 Tax=Vibrio sp. JC009 TaxID=2912314 RepID=UPI0023AF5903|nr:ABC transporter permease [Vibrio sp. JC009]WED24145.1 ABC transporter permease [Vibrio sp. JC009]
MALVKKRAALQIWGDVIFAIFLREVRGKSSDKLGIAWSVVSPVAFIFFLSFFRGKLDGGMTHGVPTFYFMVYGMILIQFFLGTVSSVSGAITKNKPLYAFRQVQPLSSVIAITVLELLIKLFVVFAIAVICFFLEVEFYIADPLEVILIFIRVWLFCTSIGLIFALLKCYVPELDKIRSLAMRPMFFISGLFFSLQDFPREYWPYLNWNPLLHAVELTRYAAYPAYGNVGVSYFYLDLFTLLSLCLALSCYHIGWKQAISR